MSLGNNEKKMLRCMRSKQENIWTLEELLEITQWNDQVHVAGAGKSLDENGFVETIEKKLKFITLGSEGHKATENSLLEKRIWDWILSQAENNRTMNELFNAGFERHEAGPGIGLLKSLGVSIEKGIFTFDNGQEITERISDRIDFIESLSEEKINYESLDGELVKHFSGRKNLINIEEITVREWKLTGKGINLPDKELDESLIFPDTVWTQANRLSN